MIRLNLIGGLGNQMFEYAYARALMEKFKDEEIRINPYFNMYYNLFALRKLVIWPNSLVHFKLNSKIKEMGKVEGIIKGARDSVYYIFDVLQHRNKILTVTEFKKKNCKGIYQVASFGFTFYPCAKVNKKNKYISGLFQNEKYFKDIRKILLEEFQVKTKPTYDNYLKMQELDKCNAVCVHIRRGDYLLPQFSFLNICNEKYYQRGMDYIEQHVENPVFYIFSNNKKEIEWIKQNYHFKQEVKYIELNNPDYEELRLMYHCKHFIMSNSTFSWWGSYLAPNEDKIVIAPAIWQREKYRGGVIDIYRDDMIKIDID